MHLKSDTSLRAGNYVIESVLGQGGFGITYLATCVPVGKKVAIKEFYVSGLCGRDKDSSVVCPLSEANRHTVDAYKLKFRKEAQKLRLMDHESIIKLYDVFEENATVYYVMDYIDGGSLESKVMLGGPLSEELAVHYILQVSEALKYMHDKHYLHLDVKPSNIMLSGDKAILVDFGASKHYDDNGGQTSTGPVGVSRGYAPMEQYSNDLGNFTPATDIYALGATLYRLLTGQTPPDSATLISHPEMLLFPESVPGYLADVVKKAMSPVPAARFQSATEFMSALSPDTTKVYEEAVVPVAPENVPQPKKKRKTWILWIVLLLLLMAGAGYLILSTSGGSSQIDDQDSSQIGSPGPSQQGGNGIVNPKDSTKQKEPIVTTPPGDTPPGQSGNTGSSTRTPPVEPPKQQIKPADDGKIWVYIDYDFDLSLFDAVPESISASYIKRFKGDFASRLTSSDDRICITDNASKAEKKAKVQISVKKYTEPRPQYFVWVAMTCSVNGKSFNYEDSTLKTHGVKGGAVELPSDNGVKEKVLGLAFGDALTKVIDAIPQKFIDEIKK